MGEPRFYSIDRPVDVKFAYASDGDVRFGCSDQSLHLFQSALSLFERIESFTEHFVLAAKSTRGDLGLHAGFQVGWDSICHFFIIGATPAQIKLNTAFLERHR